MAPFMRLRLVQCILTATPNNRFSKTEQLPALVQSWLSIVSLSRQIHSSLGDKAWPIHDGEARRVYCTGIWLNMPGRRQHRTSNSVSASSSTAAVEINREKEGVLLGFYTYLCTKLITEYHCPTPALDGILEMAIQRVLRMDDLDKSLPRSPSVVMFHPASVQHASTQAHAKILESLQFDMRKLIDLQSGKGRDAVRTDQLLMHCLRLGKLYQRLRSTDDPSVKEQKGCRVWKLAPMESVSSDTIRKLLHGVYDNQFGAHEYDNFINSMGTYKNDLVNVKIEGVTGDAVLAALKHPHLDNFINENHTRIIQVPSLKIEGGFDTILVMRKDLLTSFSRWGATQVTFHPESGFTPYSFIPLLLQMLFLDGWETGGPAFAFAHLRKLCGLPAGVSDNWTPDKIRSLFDFIYKKFESGADEIETFVLVASILPFLLAIDDERDGFKFKGVSGNRLEFMKIVQATPEDQLLDVCKTHCYLPVSFSSLLLGQLCTDDEKKFPEGYRYIRAELVEQVRAAKHHQHHSITSGSGGHDQPKELFWWYVFTVIDQFNSCRMKQTEGIKFPVHPLLHGANSVVCLHYDFPLGKLVSPSRGPTYVYADHLFPVWELDYSASSPGSQLDIGDRYRFIQARFTSDVNKNSLGPIQRLLQEEETKQQQQQPTVGQKRKSPPPTTANEDEPQPPAYDPDSAPPPRKPLAKKPKFGAAVSSRTTQVTLDGKMTFTVQEGKTRTTSAATLVRMPSTDDEGEEEGEDMDAAEEYRPNKHGQTAEEDYRVGWDQFGSMA
jgi:hypothetical protein